MKGDLLWVYEGLTQYLGNVLPARSGLWTPDVFREVIASDAAEMDYQTGRRWRPLVDTARAVQFTYGRPDAWRYERRRVDYYDEGLADLDGGGRVDPAKEQRPALAGRFSPQISRRAKRARGWQHTILKRSSERSTGRPL